MRLGTTEILLLIVLAILLFGGSKIAGLGKALGTSIREFKSEVNAGKKEEGDTAKAEMKKDESDS